jgi:RNA polymerase sigma-70 factor (ECF subfamily)
MPDITCLLQRAKCGDTQALGALLEIYRNYLTVLARLQIEPALRGKLSTSDLVQETFLNAKQGIAGFRGRTEAELMAWLRRIMANRLSDALRRFSGPSRAIQTERQLADQMEQSSMVLGHIVPSHEPSPCEQLEQREQEVLLADALAALPDAYRDVLVLRHLKGLRFGEVAEQMGRSVDSVKNLWVRAIDSLRSALESQP